MKIYILGASGMLGSKLFEEFFNSKHQVRGSLRVLPKKFLKYKNNLDLNIDVHDIFKLKKKIIKFNPDVIINCIGAIKQKIKILMQKTFSI